MKPHANKGNSHAAKPFKTQARTMRFAETDWQEFERLAGGSGRILTKWILQAAKEKAGREM
jgi:hypothetical protein